jgi:hypothetical protein
VRGADASVEEHGVSAFAGDQPAVKNIPLSGTFFTDCGSTESS